MGILDRARAFADRGRASFQRFTAPVVPGVGLIAPRQYADSNREITRIIRSPEALLGSIATGAGPSLTAMSSYPADGIDPVQVVAIFRQADRGYPRLQSELYEQLIEGDGHLRAVAEARINGITANKPRVQAFNETPVAKCVQAFVKAVLDEIEDFDRSLEALLWANGYGYAACEIVWGLKTIRFPTPDGKSATIEALCPVSLDWVHQKHFEFDLLTDERYLYLNSGRQTLPPNKFVFHAASGAARTARRGYMRAATKLLAYKRWAERDWVNYCHIYGVPQLRGVYNGDTTQYFEHRDLYEKIMRDFGKGVPAIHGDDFKIQIDNPPPGGKSNDPQGAMIGWCNAEISKLVQHETLTTEMGGVGSYNASETHADVKHSVHLSDARKLADTERRDLLKPIVRLNAERLAAACRERPDDVIRATPFLMWRIDREMSPEVRARVYAIGVNELGSKLSEDQFMDEMGFDAPAPGKPGLGGKPVQVGTGGLVGSLEAARKGAEPPKDPATPAHGSEGKADGSGTKPAQAPAESAPHEAVHAEAAKLKAVKIELTSTDLATIVRVDEARESQGLPPIGGEDGKLTIAEFKAKHEAVIAKAVSAEAGPQAQAPQSKQAP